MDIQKAKKSGVNVKYVAAEQQAPLRQEQRAPLRQEQQDPHFEYQILSHSPALTH